MFLVKQKTKSGRVYVHLATSVHRPGKTPTHVRSHLGVLDSETGELLLSKKFRELPPEVDALLRGKNIPFSGRRAPAKGRAPRPPRAWASGSIVVEELGRVAALLHLAEESGLASALRLAFGLDSRPLLCAAIHQVCEAEPLYLLEEWLENVSGGECDGVSLSAAGLLAGTLGSVGALEARRKFFSAWIKALGTPRVLVRDTTSISSYSKVLEAAEWGYNRDGESLPQVNLALVVARDSGIPIWYRSLPGSIPDVASLKGTASQLKSLGMREFSFTLDRGCFSNANLAALVSDGVDFIIGVPLHISQARALLRRRRRALLSFKRHFLANGTVLSHVPCAIRLVVDGTEGELPAHLYFCKERHTLMTLRMEKSILEIAAAAGKASLESYREAREWLDANAGRHAPLFRLRMEEGKPVISIKPNRVAGASAYFGFTLVATSRGGGMPSDREVVLEEYRSRDLAEKVFDVYKNATGNNRLRTGNDDAAEGRMFIAFLAVTIRALLERRLRDVLGKKAPTVPEALARLAKIKRIRQSGHPPVLLEVPKKSRVVAEAVGMETQNVCDVVASLAREPGSKI